MNVSVKIFALIVITGSLFAFYVSRSVSAERAKESVLIVNTTVEVRPNPFMFFFGQRTDNMFGAHGGGKPVVHYHGTAFVLEGHLITAAHVILPDVGEKVLDVSITTHGGQSRHVKVLRTSKSSDLAELATVTGVDLDLPSLSLATRTPRVGDKVFEIGHPALIFYVVSRGEIVGFDSEQGYDIAALDTFGGDSGGPVIDSNGKVMGVCHTLIRGSRFTGIGTLAALTEFLYPNQVR